MNEGQTILLADDSENDVDLMRIAFRKAQSTHPIQHVRNGQEAIAYLNGDGIYGDRHTYPLPAVMLLDLNMPMKTGFDVLDWLLTQPSLKPMTVIVLSASTRIEDVERAFDLGAHSFLVKSSTLAQLVTLCARLRDWLEINHFPPHNHSVKRL